MAVVVSSGDGQRYEECLLYKEIQGLIISEGQNL